MSDETKTPEPATATKDFQALYDYFMAEVAKRKQQQKLERKQKAKQRSFEKRHAQAIKMQTLAHYLFDSH